MRTRLDPFSFLVVSIAGWINQRQHRVIEYLIEENRVLREQIGDRRMRFSDSQRRRLAAKANRPQAAETGCHHRHAGNVAGLAPKVDCHEVRWQLEPNSGTAAHDQ
jgi:hypothetical protein